MTIEEFDEIKNLIKYDFQKDNHFTEMKDAEIYRERIQTMRDMDEYVGRYYSQEWVRKNVLYQSDEDIEEINKQIEAEGGEEDMPQDDEQ